MIRVEGLTVVRRGMKVLDGLSCEVRAGETVAVIGGSGCGKSTLLATLAGGIAPKAGRVELEPGTRIGYVPSQLAAWPVVRADEFLEFAGMSSGLAGRETRAAVSRGLAMAGLADRPGVRIDALSDGFRKRLLFARALIDDPDLLVVDDPFGSLDPAGCRLVERLIGDAGLAGRTVVGGVNAAALSACWSRAMVLEAGRLRLDVPVPRDTIPRGWGERLVDPGYSDAAE